MTGDSQQTNRPSTIGPGQSTLVFAQGHDGTAEPRSALPDWMQAGKGLVQAVREVLDASGKIDGIQRLSITLRRGFTLK